MGWTLPPKLQALLGSRLRHIHLPDTPPVYAPRFLPGRIRDYIEEQILVQREAAARFEGPPDGMTIENYGPKPVLRAWLKTAGPPPTVLTFTRRPTYVLPKHYLQGQDTWAADYMAASLKTKLRVNFSKPPNWSRYHWIPDWHTLKKNQRPEDLDPLEHTWDPGVMIMPCAEPMYWGPGQLSIWPIMDLTDNVQRRRQLRNKFEVERLLEDTTIAVLKREYGIHAYAIPGSPGVWVDSAAPPPEVASSGLQFMSKEEREATATSPSHRRFNTRRIATVHADVINSITRFGISIHVGQPEPAVNVWTAMRNPWVALRQHESTTSIAAELAHLGTSPNYHDADQALVKRWIHKKSKYLQTEFDTSLPSSGPVQAMPYSQVSAEPGNKQPAPLGMDNRDLATAWTGVFALELGMRAGYVDHYSVVPGTNGLKSELAPRGRSVGFMSRKYDGEYEYAEPFEQVDVPVVNLVENEVMTRSVIENTIRLADKDGVLALCKPIPRALSWPLWYKQLTHVLDRSIKAEILDKRLSDISKRANEDMMMKERSLIRQAELYRLEQIRLAREQRQQPFENFQEIQETDELAEEEEQGLNQQPEQDLDHEYVSKQEVPHQQPQQEASTQEFDREQEVSHQKLQQQVSNQEYVMEQKALHQQPQQQASSQEYDLETEQAGLFPRSLETPTEKAISEPLANKLASINTEMQIILKHLELGGTWKRRLFNSTKDIQKTLEPYLNTSARARRRDPNKVANAAAASGLTHNDNNTIRRPLQAGSPATSGPTSANTATTSNKTAEDVVNAETSGWLSNLEKAMRSSALSTEEAITANAQLTDVLDLLGHKPTPEPKSRSTSASSASPTTPSQDAPDWDTDPLEKREADDLAAQALRRRVKRSLDSPKLLQDWTRTVD